MTRVPGAVLVAAVLLTLSCCSADRSEPRVPDSGAPASRDASPDAAEEPPSLTNGKGDERVAPGTYLAPAGFEPALLLDVPAGWTSVHRYPDAFDLGRPDPERDAPLVAVVVMRPLEADAAAAVDAVRRRTDGVVSTVRTRLAGMPAEAIDVRGGHGVLVASADDGIALDASPGQRARVMAVDVTGVPLLVVILVPDGSRWAEVLPEVEQLVAGITPGP